LPESLPRAFSPAEGGVINPVLNPAECGANGVAGSGDNGKAPVGKMKKVIRNGEITSLATALMAAAMDMRFHFLPRFCQNWVKCK